MRKIGFVVDSTFGVSEAFIKKENIGVVALKVMIHQDEYVDGQFDYDLVVDALRKDKKVKTAQPSPDQFMQAIQAQFDLGYEDVVVLTLSKTLSGTFNSANLAKETLEHSRVHVIDSQTTIHGGAYIAEEALRYANNHTIDEVIAYINELILSGSLLFTVNDLSTLVKNGRLSRVQAFIGNILKIKPILRFKMNTLDVEKKVRSKENVLKYIVEQIGHVDLSKHVEVKIAYVEETQTSESLLQMIKTAYENVMVKISGVISPVISAHVGLGGLGVYIISHTKR